MILNLFDRIGNCNPQLFREIKGRLKVGNIAIASALSLGAQLVLLLYFNAELWVEIFAWLSIFSVLILLVAGIHLLVSDLGKEERRGTLNLIRLSPQSAKTIFIGKIIGVPILLYLAAILTLPLHLYSGLTAQIPLYKILCFYIAVPAICSLFYSAAIVFGITNSWLRGFEPWFASCVVCLVYRISSIGIITSTTWDLLTFLSPIFLLKYMFDKGYNKLNAFHFLVQKPDKLQWFHLPIGTNIASGLVLFLLICGTGTYWMCQGWQRLFLNPTATVFSKRQSFLLIICCETIVLGFAIQFSGNYDFKILNMVGLLSFNSLMFLALILAAKVPPKLSSIDYLSRYNRLPIY